MDNLQQFLQISAKLYQHLTLVPTEEGRDSYIDTIHQLLDERNEAIIILQSANFVYDSENKSHQMLIELDRGIKSRLGNVLTTIQDDLKNLQNSKKNEKQYLNPYASVQVMDGRYYDTKK